MDLKHFVGKQADYELLRGTKYELFALTVHHGTINQGHYVAYVKRDGVWIEFNDEQFTPVSEK